MKATGLKVMATMAVLCGGVSVAEQSAAQVEAAPTPQQIVAARQTALHLSGATMGHMKAAIDRGADVTTLAYGARGVARWARALPTMFPDSTRGITPSRARPEIWQNRADFEAKAAAYAEAAGRLATIAGTGDREAFVAQFQATIATCQACHDLYQAPLNRTP
jgi:cytochrome c556